MSWAEVKKALNTDLSKPLNTLITEKHSTTDGYLTNSTYGLSAIRTLVNSLKTGGTVPIVKSVQRGTNTFSDTTNGAAQTITISTVNVSKSLLIVNFNDTSAYNGTTGYSVKGWKATLTASSISVPYHGQNLYSSGSVSSYTYPSINWQVIEFY